jgi:hypothetical protein
VFKTAKEKDFCFVKNVIYFLKREVRKTIVMNAKFVFKVMIIIACSIPSALPMEILFHFMQLLPFC